MAISFRISSFDFNLFDFLKRKDHSQNQNPENPPSNTPPIINDPNQSDIMFDILSGVISNDKPLDISQGPAVQVLDTESNEVDASVDEQKDKRKGRRKHNSDAIDKVTRDLRRKFRMEYKEVKQHYMTNVAYQLSHTELLDSKIYMGRFQDSKTELGNEDEKYIEKEKERQETDDFIKEEIKKQDRLS